MGLDSYLTKKTYIGAEFAHRKVTGEINIKVDGKPVAIDFNSVSEISERVAYWRKANHIHDWFVRNCQDGVDDCREVNVSREQLKELYMACKKILAARNNKKTVKKLVQKLLPPAEGFFFGGTEIDEYYFQDIEYTMDVIFKAVIMSAEEDSDFYYRASW